jgi:hypothetical protein
VDLPLTAVEFAERRGYYLRFRLKRGGWRRLNGTGFRQKEAFISAVNGALAKMATPQGE